MEAIDEEHAVTIPELEARISERPWRDLPVPVDPHHLTTARKALLAANAIAATSGRTRGGRLVTVLVPTDTHRKTRAVEDATKRKRLLHSRYMTWATGSATHKALLGNAGESVVHKSLAVAAPYGFRLLNPEHGEVRTIFGSPVPGGPLDNAAVLSLPSPTVIDTTNYLIPIEVKNVRSHLYPQADEVHQVLSKAAELQSAHPDTRIVPVLVCRRAHATLFSMAKQIGAFVVETRQQPITPSAELRLDYLDEVRTELLYDDMTTDVQALPWLVDRFRVALRQVAKPSAERWAASAATVRPHSHVLRVGMTPRDRGRLMEEYRAALSAELEEDVRW